MTRMRKANRPEQTKAAQHSLGLRKQSLVAITARKSLDNHSGGGHFIWAASAGYPGISLGHPRVPPDRRPSMESSHLEQMNDPDPSSAQSWEL